MERNAPVPQAYLERSVLREHAVHIHPVLAHVVLPGELLRAHSARVALAVVLQVALHVPPEAAAVVEGSLAHAATWRHALAR